MRSNKGDNGYIGVKKIRVLSVIATVFSAATLASFGVLSRWLKDDFHFMTQVFGRMALAFLFVAIINALRPRPIDHQQYSDYSNLWRFLYMSSFPLSAIAFTISVNIIPLSVAVFTLFSVSLLVTSMGSQIFLERKFDLTANQAILLSLSGLALAWCYECETTIAGVFIAFAAGLFDGLANLSRKALPPQVAHSNLSTQFLWGSIISGVLIVVFNESLPKDVAMKSWGLLVVFSILIVAVAYTLIFAFRNITASMGAQLLSTELAFAALFGWLLFDESQSARQLVGVALLIAGALLIVNKSNGSNVRS